MKSSFFRIYLIVIFALMSLILTSVVNGQIVDLTNNQKIKDLIAVYHNQNRFDGIILVAKNGNKIFSEGFGNANLELNVPNSPDKKYLLASVTKIFTSTLIMKLVDQGNIKLDTKLSEVLPWYRKDNGRIVTIKQLLNHTSGIPNYMNLSVQSVDELNREFGTVPIDKVAFAKKYCQGNLEFEPGTKWNYNNSAYLLLALIVEQVTGKCFDFAMNEMIFNPLKMNESGDLQPEPDRIVENLATGYLKTLDGFCRMHYWNLSTALGAGSIYSTADDMLKFDQALYSESFLSAKVKSEMFTPGLNGYGCGWELRETRLGSNSELKKIQTHEGFLWAWHTRFYRIPEDGYCVLIISNTGDSPLERMFTGITDILYGRNPVFPKPSLCLEIKKKYQTVEIEKAISYGKSLLNENSEEWDISENEHNAWGYELLRSNLLKDAVKLFQWNSELHPESWNVWDSYGEALMRVGRKQEAIRAYQKSVELNPANKSGLEMLEKLKDL